MARPFIRSEKWHDPFSEGRGPGGSMMFNLNDISPVLKRNPSESARGKMRRGECSNE